MSVLFIETCQRMYIPFHHIPPVSCHPLECRAEVPGSPIFMMQLCSGARHIEVQIVGDEPLGTEDVVGYGTW